MNEIPDLGDILLIYMLVSVFVDSVLLGILR